jgi:putative transposase
VAVPEREDLLSRALGCTDSEHALTLNQAERRSGHVWQNRFFSCPLDPPHLISAM